MTKDIRLTIKQAARSREIENPSQLATEAKISRSMATAAWNETRDPDLRTLWKIAKALNCDLSDLVRFVGTKNGTKASRSSQS